MSRTSTPNLGLVKPTPGTGELADVNVINGNMDLIDAAIGVPSPVVASFFQTGTLTVKTGAGRWYIAANATILSVQASVGTAPTGAAVIVDINKNGTTIFTTQTNRPTIAVSTNTSGLVSNMSVTALAANDYLTVDIDQIGSTVAGADLTVQIRYRLT